MRSGLVAVGALRVMPATTLQILALPGTKVIAGARPGENQDDLKLLSDQNEGRLLPVQMELLDKDSVKVSACLFCSFSTSYLQLTAPDRANKTCVCVCTGCDEHSGSSAH